jgi:hypothetical protein
VPHTAAAADDEYQARLRDRRAARDRLTDSDARFAYARLATFALGVALTVLVWRPGIGPWWLLAPLVAFGGLVWGHARVLRAREFALRRIAFYERGVARLEDRWAGAGEPGDRFRDDQHVYANDLDLFGHGSLFELLSQARTRTGEAMLAAWLTAPADPSEIRARQVAVEELASALDLREQLAASGTDVRESVRTDRLLDWAESPMPSWRTLETVTWAATAATIAAIGYMALTGAWWPFAIVMALQLAALRRFRHDIAGLLSAREPGAAAGFVADALTHRARDLDAMADLLTHLEDARFRSPRLVQLHDRLAVDGRASRVIRRLERLADAHNSQENAIVLPLGLFLLAAYSDQAWMLDAALGVGGLLLLVRPQLALAVARWRQRHAADVRVWIDTIAQFEALGSFAAYRYEHADDPFPDVLPLDEAAHPTALFDGVQLGHPLLPRGSMVRNDVRLAGDTRLLVVSGSNMSGKSTLLRTVGVNAVLALAGAPVRAASLRLTPMAIGATLRIQDSLVEGRSRFYAEITRIRALADLATGPRPLLFLLDEIFHGTNSHDRLLGAAGVLRSLVDRGAIGLITTHDLALTALVDDFAPRAVNVHFEDSFEGGTMAFDYRMRPGPVTRSNALALMRAVGLEVGLAEGEP